MNRHPRWMTAAIIVVSLLMVVVAVMLLIAVVRLGVPTDLIGELTEASGAVLARLAPTA